MNPAKAKCIIVDVQSNSKVYTDDNIHFYLNRFDVNCCIVSKDGGYVIWELDEAGELTTPYEISPNENFKVVYDKACAVFG